MTFLLTLILLGLCLLGLSIGLFFKKGPLAKPCCRSVETPGAPCTCHGPDRKKNAPRAA